MRVGAEQLAEVGRRLAAEGVVVFAPNYRTDFLTDQGVVDLARDVECAYRYVRSVADEYGGDIDQPVTFVGWSLGATLAIQAGLDEEIDPSGEFVSCFDEVPRADVIVAISGCHNDVPPNMFNADEWTNRDVDVVLVAGTDDTNCPASQTHDAHARLNAAGYDAEVVVLEGADHLGPVFHAFEDGEMEPESDDPAGERVVKLILDAIGGAEHRGE